jgi:hypothetical protein
LCKKVFLGASRQIKFGWRHLFPDFAKQNQEKDVSITFLHNPNKIWREAPREDVFLIVYTSEWTTKGNIFISGLSSGFALPFEICIIARQPRFNAEYQIV